MKKLSALFVSILLLSSTCIDGYDPKSRINISIVAPGCFQNQSQRISPFQSAFAQSSNHDLHSGQQSQYGRMSHLMQDRQQEKHVGIIAGLLQRWQERQARKEAERVKKEAKQVVAAQVTKSVTNAFSSVVKNSIPGKTVSVSGALTSNVDLSKIYALQEKNKEHVTSVGRAGDDLFHQTMYQRLRALHGSKQNTVTTEQRTINLQTAGFLQAQNIDTAQFQQVDGVLIQHQLTKELVGILDAIADRALHSHELYQTNLAKYCAHLASATQQANIAGIVSQAISGTNCCHGMRYYLDGMMSTVDQQRQKFRAAMNYLQPVLEEYALILEQRGLQAAAIAQGLETIVAAGMIIAPTATTVATACMIGLSAAVMAPVCAQALMQVHRLDAACIRCDWNQLYDDFDRLAWLAHSPESIGYLADIVGAAMVPTPALHGVVEQVMSLRPVITRVQQVSGQTVQKLYLMGKNQLEHVYQQGIELLQLPEFANFNMMYKKIWGWNIFELLPKSNPALAGAFGTSINAVEQAAITNLFSQSENQVVGKVAENAIKSGVSKFEPQAAQAVEQVAQIQIDQQVEYIAAQKISTDTELQATTNAVSKKQTFLETDIGKQVKVAAKKDYEFLQLTAAGKTYNQYIKNQAPQEIINLFLETQKLLIAPEHISKHFEDLHAVAKSINAKNIIKMRHIFYPNIKIKLTSDYQNIKEVILEGFHHDQNNALEKLGLFTFESKVYGSAEFGAEECFIGVTNFGNGIICYGDKTFFPPSWSQKKVVEVISRAAKNKLKVVSLPEQTDTITHLCQDPKTKLFVEVVIDKNDAIGSAYPSLENFKGIKK